MDRQHDHTPRLRTWDYSSAGAYFVTFKVQDRRPVLSTVGGEGVVLTPAGRIVQACWRALPQDFQVALDSNVIMPDHVHAILMLEPSSDEPPPARSACGFRPMMSDPAITLGKVIRAWKARATVQIRRAGDPSFAWQSRYFDRVIRNQEEIDRIRAYVQDNPKRWLAPEQTPRS